MKFHFFRRLHSLVQLLWFSLFLLSACAALPTPPADDTFLFTATPTLAASATPTVVWFPPTPTPTVYVAPEVAPTPDQRPGIGASILEDDFTNPSLWSTGENAQGSVAFGKSELTIAIAQTRTYLFSVRSQTDLKDFYLTITTSPSLCQGADSYGLLLRYNSPKDLYRFSATCDGRLRLERINNGQVSIVQDWTYSSQVPLGSPSTSHIGIWAVGSELRFFVDDIYQFSAHDPVFSHGGLGVFARSAGETAVTVNFSNLTVSQVSAPLPTPSNTPTAVATQPSISK